MSSTIASAASYAPEAELTSRSIVEKINTLNGFDFDLDFIENVTGIISRKAASTDEHPSMLAHKASELALARIGLTPRDIDTLIFASAGADILTPATANIVCDLLGTQANCFDINNACNSFLNGLQVAALLVESGTAENIIVCTGEVTTKALRYDFKDMRGFSEHFTGVTFGDGGGAVVVSRSSAKGFVDFDNKSFPTFWSDGGVFAGGSRNLRNVNFGFFRGDPVRLKSNNEAVSKKYSEFVLDKIHELGFVISDFKFVLTHQVTVKSRSLFHDSLGVAPSQTVPIIENRGNLTSASLPTQLSLIWDELASGDAVLSVSVGGGISAGMNIWIKQ